MSTKKKSRVWTYFEEDFFYQSAASWECKIPFTWVSQYQYTKAVMIVRNHLLWSLKRRELKRIKALSHTLFGNI